MSVSETKGSLDSIYFFLRGVWAKVLPAADLDALLVLPSRSTLEAALAAFLDVCLLGVTVWDKALAELVFVVLEVDLERSVLEADFAAFLLVVFLFLAMGNIILNK